MNKTTPVEPHQYGLPPTDIDGFDSLAELALDLRWTWNHCTDDIWEKLAPEIWELTENPWAVLQTVARDQLKNLLADPPFREKIAQLVKTRRQALESPAWFQRTHTLSPLTCVAYFSMEYMLSEALPIYSGGLGNVAGDQLKAASDLGVPVVAIGLLYQQGYFRQVIDKEGAQEALYPYNDPGQLPITPVRQPNGEWLRIELDLPGYRVWLRTWQVQVGRVKLYLLDSNDLANFPAYRSITSQLYGGGPELRLQQELVLGIGGWRLLQALGIQPEVCHLNEGHAAFAILERALSFAREHGKSFECALAVTRAGNLFTTHTAAAAGFDRFAPELVEKYLQRYADEKLHISSHDLLALGRQNPADDSEKFNMAFLAIHGSGAVNGVSRLHGKVSRQLFQPLFPNWPEDEVPIGHVTNGVHMPTWDSAEADTLWTEACGKERWLGTKPTLEKDMLGVSDDRLWKFRTAASKSCVNYVRKRLALQLTASGATTAEIERAKQLLDPNALTLGFARRFATYKRPDLLLRDPERLLRLLNNYQRPVQLLIAGKAHPADKPGQELIQKWVQFIARPETNGRVIFLSDYDMLLTERLVQGVDVWINTPRRPWEACGTSGMKVLVNGGINLSELDGWWDEAYTSEVGWALGDGQEHGDDSAWDDIEAHALYERLEQEVIPSFYSRGTHGLPTAWLARMRESMAKLTPRFSADHTVRKYTDCHYLPAAGLYRARAANHGGVGKEMIAWQKNLEEKWSTLEFSKMKVETRGEQHLFEVLVCLHELDPQDVRIELYAESERGAPAVRQEMKRGEREIESPRGYLYRVAVSAARPTTDYTARIIPNRNGVAVPLEESRILWER
jgi:starch phosphorylase